MHILNFIDFNSIVYLIQASCPASGIGEKFPFGFFFGSPSSSGTLTTDVALWGITVSAPFLSNFIASVKWAIIFRFLITMLLSL